MKKPRMVFEVLETEPMFLAYKDHIVAVFQVGNGSTIGLRFESIEQLLTFFVYLMNKAVLTWPDHELIKEYISEE